MWEAARLYLSVYRLFRGSAERAVPLIRLARARELGCPLLRCQGTGTARSGTTRDHASRPRLIPPKRHRGRALSGVIGSALERACTTSGTGQTRRRTRASLSLLRPLARRFERPG